MVILKKGGCEHCERTYRYSLWHCGFGDNSYAYCDACGMLGLLNYSTPQVADLPRLKNEYAEIDESWEPYLRHCECGGNFRKGQSPRCPFCKEKLSPTHAAEHIETQAMVGNRGWHWQNDWSGVYCMAIDDPSNPGELRQIFDPLVMLQIKTPKMRSRWASLFSHR